MGDENPQGLRGSRERESCIDVADGAPLRTSARRPWTVSGNLDPLCGGPVHEVACRSLGRVTGQPRAPRRKRADGMTSWVDWRSFYLTDSWSAEIVVQPFLIGWLGAPREQSAVIVQTEA